MILLGAAALPAAARGAAPAGTTPRAAPAPKAAPTAPIAPFKCPDSGPNAGLAPQAMARTAGRTLVLCADTEASEGPGVVATAVAIHEPASASPLKPIYAAEDDTNRLRVASIPEGGFALTLEALLPLGQPEYSWTPITAFDVACGPQGCGERPARCALSLSAVKRATTGQVRQLTRGGRLDPGVAQRLVDDLTVDALAGEDVAAWTVENLDRLLALPTESRPAMEDARALLARARDAGCEALIPPKEQAVVAMTPAQRAAEIKEKIARRQAAAKDGTAASEPAPAAIDLQAVEWLVGGRWEGQGKMADGTPLHVEESYRWGPGRRTIRFQAKNAGGKAAPGAKAGAVEGILFFEPRSGKIILWNVKPGGGLSESAVTRADGTGCEMVGPDGRVRLGLFGLDVQNRTVEQLQAGTWKTVATANYERHPR